MTNSHLLLLPILLPLAAAALGLLVRKKPLLQKAVSLAAILASLGASLLLLAGLLQGGPPLVFQAGGWQAPFGISLVGDFLGIGMAVMGQLVLATGLIYALGARDYAVGYPTFYPLFLTMTTGLTGVFLTGDLFNMFVFVELLVVSSAVLTAISDDKFGAEAAYKYFYISLLASMFLLITAGALYASYGTLNMADLSRQISADPARPLVPLAMVSLMVFFLVKSAVVPFHFWQPDFHAVSPTAVSAMLSSVVVKQGVYGFIRMRTLLFIPWAEEIGQMLVVLGVAGVVFGGLAAIGASHAKRMLAYSTLAQIGFILVAIGWGTPLALLAALVFTFNHSLVKSAMLMLAGAVASRAPVKTAAFEVIQGLGKAMPFGGALFLLGGLALAGIPPTNGFINKMLVFRSGIESGQFLVLVFLAAASLFTIIYTGRAFMRIWWMPAGQGVKVKSSGDSLLAPALLIGLALILGIWPEPLLGVAGQVVEWLSTPLGYIQAVFNTVL